MNTYAYNKTSRKIMKRNIHTNNTKMDILDFLFKDKLGRLGLDANLPWYEEQFSRPALIPNNCIMIDDIPNVVPNLVQGGFVCLDAADASFDSRGVKIPTHGSSGVLTSRIRASLQPVKVYNRDSMCYVYTDEQSRLQHSFIKLGCIVEYLDSQKNEILITSVPYVLLGAHIVFEQGWPIDTNIYISFYEYTGSLGIPRLDVASSHHGSQANGEAVQTPVIHSTDDINEGICNMYYTNERFRASLATITSDDIQKGNQSLQESQNVLDLTCSISKLQHDLYIIDHNLHTKIEKLQLQNVESSDESLHFNADTFDMFFKRKDTDELREGCINRFLRQDTLLSISSCLHTCNISESQSALYFTDTRVLSVAIPAVQKMLDLLRVDDIKGAAADITLNESIMFTKRGIDLLSENLSSLKQRLDSTVTDDIPEGEVSLYFSTDRVHHIVEPMMLSCTQMINDLKLSDIAPGLDIITPKQLEQTINERLTNQSLDDIIDGTNRKLLDVEDVVQHIKYHMPSVCKNTDDINEGSINLYFSDSRVRDVVQALSTDDLKPGEDMVTRKYVYDVISEQMTYTSLDNVPDGNIRTLLQEGHVHSLISVQIGSLTLDDVRDGEFRRAFTADDFACLNDTVASLKTTRDHNDRIDMQLHELDNTLHTALTRDDELHTAIRHISTQVHSLTTNHIIEGSDKLYFSTDRVRSAMMPYMNTDMVREGNINQYFTYDRCISVCETLISPFGDVINSSLSMTALTLSSDINVLAEQLHVRHTNAFETLDSRIGAVNAQIDHHNTSVAIILSTHGKLLHDITERDHTHLIETQELINQASHTFKLHTDQVTEKVDSKHVYFTPARSLSVHAQMYTRVHALETRLLTLKTSSTTLSDDRLKFDEQPLHSALSVMQLLQPMKYRMVLSIGQTPGDDYSFDDVGFIAQDVMMITNLAHAVTAGTDYSPYTLDYHSITTFAVAAIKELESTTALLSQNLSNMSANDIADNTSNRWLNQGSFDLFYSAAIEGVTTDDIPEGTKHKYAPDYALSTLNLEELRFGLSQLDTDDLREGTNNRFHRDYDFSQLTSDNITEGHTNRYYTDDRCDSRISKVMQTLTTNDIAETSNRQYLTLTALQAKLKYITADYIVSGVSNKYLNINNFIALQINTNQIPEAGTNLYFKDERARSAVHGMSSDCWTQGQYNLFVTDQNIQTTLARLDTYSLPDRMGRRYMSRESFFELHISVGDIASSEELALSSDLLSTANSLWTGLSTNTMLLELNVLSTSHSLYIQQSVNTQRLESNILSVANSLKTDQSVSITRLELYTLSVCNSQQEQLSETSQILQSDLLVLSNNLQTHIFESVLHFDSRINLVQNNLQLELSTGLQFTDTKILSISNFVNTEILIHSLSCAYMLSVNNTQLNVQLYNIRDTLYSLQETDNNILSVAHNNLTNKLSEYSLSCAYILSVNSMEIYNSVHNIENDLQTKINSVNQSLNAYSNTTSEHILSISSILNIHTETLGEHQQQNISIGNVFTDNTQQIISISNKVSIHALQHQELSLSLQNTLISTSNTISLQASRADIFEADLYQLTTDSIPEGSRKYATISNVRNALMSLSTSDLPESDTHRFVSKASIVDTGLKASDLYMFDQTYASYFEATISTISSDTINEGEKNLFYNDSRVESFLSRSSTDDVQEGAQNLYFSTQRVLQTLTNISSDDVQQGANNIYLTPQGLQNRCTSSDLPEGTQLYYTPDRVRHELSVATTDSVPEGQTHKYVTKDNIVATGLAVSDLTNNNDQLELLSNESFLRKALQVLSTDTIIEGSRRFVSLESIKDCLQSLSTDDLPEGTQKFFSQALFDQFISTKTTDDVMQGSNMYHTPERVHMAVQSLGMVALQCVSNVDNEVDVLAVISTEQVLGGVLKLGIAGNEIVLPLQRTVIYTFRSLLPGWHTVSAELISMYGDTNVYSDVLVKGKTPLVQEYHFLPIGEDYVDTLQIVFSGIGLISICLSVSDLQLYNKKIHVSNNTLQITLNAIFKEGLLTITDENMNITTTHIQMTQGLRVLTRRAFTVATNAPFNINHTVFSGIQIVLQSGSQEFNANAFIRHRKFMQPIQQNISLQNTLPAAVRYANNTYIEFGIEHGHLLIRLNNNTNTSYLQLL